MLSYFKLKHNKSFELGVLGLFAIIILIGTLNHAMWRDELNGWLIARDSVSFVDFFHNIKYEGHPLLWYLCLLILNQLTPNPVAMQLFHWLISTGAFGLFILFSPFKRIQKVLFIFGYLPLYEYSLISRNYSIGILFVFLFCIFFPSRHKSYLPLAFILALMANTNAYCLLISLALALTLMIEYAFKNKLNYETKANIYNLVYALLLLGIGIIISVFMLLPPGDSTLQGGADQWLFQFDFNRLTQTITRIWRSYILVIIPSDSKPTDLVLFSFLSLGLFGFAITILIKKPIALCFYLMGSLQILLFTYLKFLGSQRHYGHLYIILITALWIAYYYPESDVIVKYLSKLPAQFSRLWLKWFKFVELHKQTLIMIILWLQVIAGIVAFSRDLITPYSASKATAKFIQENNLTTNLMIGTEDFAVSPISGYLNQKIYYPETQNLGSYVLFSQERKLISDADLMLQINQLIAKQNKPILLIINREFNQPISELNMQLLASFRKAFIYNEKYYLYFITQKNND
ncbi:hypothetical protein [Crocosphaera sp. XPORK-15E]|uniref:hypothetical protein n=1 Tax=Crocosphaera sp. XPORK-15E TaxID=3110247 RepID=UPI002B1F864F|nr:hypothetical protein [Crocosphaera sp. XPORK-15E]MEA5534362.1 hypothetical protein [Crocosphaera sp. XPORK-15E]